MNKERGVVRAFVFHGLACCHARFWVQFLASIISVSAGRRRGFTPLHGKLRGINLITLNIKPAAKFVVLCPGGS